ncbi:MAG: glycosyltransferase family 39 protein [Candidatus Rokubacteria bacterium]|nr:glycosyltransferase family 39 protein [Candidatus Rokubacteria bacterium]
MRLLPLGVAAIAAALYLVGLGAAPFVDPPEGFHAEIAREIARDGNWLTPRLNGVRYFDKPPLLHWLMAASFKVMGPTPFAARLWSALAAIGCAAVTARLGMLLGGPRVGLLAGLMVAANLGMFLYGRLVKPDLVFILCITLAYAGFAAAYLGRGGWRGLGLFYGALGLATLAKDPLGAVGPLVAVMLFFWLTRERPLAPWRPWWGVALLAGLAVPWYVAVELENRGFLWYAIVDNHLLNLLRQRVFPDEDVPLGALEFLVVTLAAFLPWSLGAPAAALRALRRPWEGAGDRVWGLLALWAVLLIGFFTFSPFKLPHYGLPALPALALLTARLWDDTIAGRAGGVGVRTLLAPMLVVFALAAAAFGAAWGGVLPIPRGAMTAVDMASRNLAARGQSAAEAPLDVFRPVLATSAVIFALATVGLLAALRRRSAELGATVALAAMLAFLPVAGRGMTEFARSRSVAPLAEALLARWQSGQTIVHEGALENTGALLLMLPGPVHVVSGLVSNLAFGATFPDARDVFWEPERVREEWAKPGRRFLISAADPARSVVGTLPPPAVHLIATAGGRRLYSNLAD